MSYSSFFARMVAALGDVSARKTIKGADGLDYQVMPPEWAETMMDMMRSQADIELDGPLKLSSNGEVPAIIINTPQSAIGDGGGGIVYKTENVTNVTYGPTSIVYNTIANNYTTNSYSNDTPGTVYQTVIAPNGGGTPIVGTYERPITDANLNGDLRAITNPITGIDNYSPGYRDESGGGGPNAVPGLGIGVYPTMLLTRSDVTSICTDILVDNDYTTESVVNTLIQNYIDTYYQELSKSVVTDVSITNATVNVDCTITITLSKTTETITYLSPI